MHTMNDTPKILSIIGSVFDFLGVISLAFTAYIFKFIFTEDFFDGLVAPEEMGEIQEIVELYQVIGNVMIVFAMIIGLVFIINLIVNLKLIRGKLTEQQAKKAYTYQLFIGVVLILLNTIAGIVYIVSGIKGRDNEPDRIDTRAGI